MAADQDIETLFETLLAEGMLEEFDDGTSIRLTDAFERARERRREEVEALSEAEFESEANAFLADTPASAADVDRDLLIDAMAAVDVCGSLDVTAALQVADSLDRLEATVGEAGVPAGFVSVPGEEIEAFLQRHPASLLYFWREDCEPCDELKADLEELLQDGEIPEAFGLGAVYGPDCPTEILRSYEVGAAPTILFCAGDRVDSRFVGAPGRNPVANEIQVLEDEVGL